MLTEQHARTGQDGSGKMDFGFLVHLAGMGAADLHPLGRRATALLIESLDLQAGQNVLEVGCGTGATMVRLERYNLARIDGLDLLPAMLRVARRRLRLAGLGARSRLYLAKPGAPFPIPYGTYDRVYTESVLGMQDAEGARALLNEICRVVRPGGRYVANEAIWREGVPSETIASINAGCLRDFGLRMASDAPWSLPDWLQVMQEAGFRVLSAELISEQIAGRQYPVANTEYRAILSAAVTRSYWLRGLLTPRARMARARYRRLNDRHREDGQYIEPRLFVLEKPLG
jgi:ubiquinone/menaquinone biosynthesis C-methylase UbiE